MAGRRHPIDVYGAQLDWAKLAGAHLEGTNLAGAPWGRLTGAHLEGTNLAGAHLGWPTSPARISRGPTSPNTVCLLEAQLRDAHGDAATKLPAGMTRPTR